MGKGHRHVDTHSEQCIHSVNSYPVDDSIKILFIPAFKTGKESVEMQCILINVPILCSRKIQKAKRRLCLKNFQVSKLGGMGLTVVNDLNKEVNDLVEFYE